MKKIGERITFKEHEDFHTIVISPTIEKWQMNSLFVWLLAWSVCGVVFAYYIMFEMGSMREVFIFGVLLVFWIYFEFRVARAFLWRKYGLEIIKIDAEQLSVKDSIFKYGDAKSYLLDDFQVEDVESVYVNPKSYGKVMNDSFWLVGQGTIAINYKEKIFYFGTQLENKDSDKLAKLIRKLVGQYMEQRDAAKSLEVSEE